MRRLIGAETTLFGKVGLLMTKKISKAHKHITLTANYIKRILGLDLTPEEDRVENEFLGNTKSEINSHIETQWSRKKRSKVLANAS